MADLIQIDAAGCILGALLLLTLPLDWLLAAVTAAGFHECCHGAVILLLGGKIRSVRIGAAGVVMEADIPGLWQELFSAAAGPAGSFLLLVFCHRIPKLAICALIQGAFNMLPIYPLDGGRMLRCGLLLACPKVADKGQTIIQTVVLGGALCLVIYAAWRFSLGILPVAAVLGMIRVTLRKIPCKRRQIRVQ